ncbi:SDR family NAD(P)-dependent oxidoreductase [Thalassovita taeanensis]|uniref:NAD(P)-dependent dehydrogenase, short-chain alcohol dehydrogenase family n=1 Tax=Thalassovita taeanensis TaxID=657014 RepID=A0A1H9L2R3_9RHOB|nr:SDR family oxidoreductase [Thalassovita taeanensis]SER05549.1 NAD(P)-dependent dehydrogenase, short-chain alcohol dehydrogenase family [Thalassovita taeanensis]
MKQNVVFKDLAGKSVFVTGGGSGIGASLTEGFLAQGAKVAFVQRSDAGAFVDRMAETYGAAPLFLPCDITDVSALKDCLSQAAARHGPVSALVNNAANDARHTLAETTVEAWDKGMAINLRPHFFTAQAVAEGMRKLGGGSIINFSSISYMMGNGGYPGYMAAKAGITGVTRALARELGPDNIRVNALMPGWVLTERQKELWATPEDLKAHLEKQCLKHHLTPEDVVDTTLFLASDASKMMTAQALVVDGGVVMTG